MIVLWPIVAVNTILFCFDFFNIRSRINLPFILLSLPKRKITLKRHLLRNKFGLPGLHNELLQSSAHWNRRRWQCRLGPEGLCTSVHTTFLLSFFPSFFPFFLPSFLSFASSFTLVAQGQLGPEGLSTSVHSTFLLSFLRPFLPPFLPTSLPHYPPSYLPPSLSLSLSLSLFSFFLPSFFSFFLFFLSFSLSFFLFLFLSLSFPPSLSVSLFLSLSLSFFLSFFLPFFFFFRVLLFLTQAGVQWRNLHSLQLLLPGSSDSPASASRVAGIIGVHHHTLLNFVFLEETGFYHVSQAGLELLISGVALTSASQSAGITGVNHCTQPLLSFHLAFVNGVDGFWWGG
ncbi:uncharacterized protein LOC129053931 [Pongo abelii]|uniref:uncharacterized protein LOC129053931 n=1 Tax=Pongo abelii TaxID=9601 RepID=UPI0023E81C2F|nr:uncharacterized protein LOC129053931 [Pongo abelii]